MVKYLEIWCLWDSAGNPSRGTKGPVWMELSRFAQWSGDLWSFGFPKRGLKGRPSGHKAFPPAGLAQPLSADYWASESVLMENNSGFERLNETGGEDSRPDGVCGGLFAVLV